MSKISEAHIKYVHWMRGLLNTAFNRFFYFCIFLAARRKAIIGYINILSLQPIKGWHVLHRSMLHDDYLDRLEFRKD